MTDESWEERVRLRRLQIDRLGLIYDSETLGPKEPQGCENISECGAYMCELGAGHADSLHKSLSTGGSWETGEPVVHSSERVAMNVEDWIQVDEDEKEIRLVLPEGWRTSILAADSGLALEANVAPSVPPNPPLLCLVTAKRVAVPT